MRSREVLASKIGNDRRIGRDFFPVAVRRNGYTDVFEFDSSALFALTVSRFIACHDQNAGQSPSQSRLNRQSYALKLKNSATFCH